MTVVVERASLTVAHLSHICVVMTRGPATIEGVCDIHDGAEQLAQRVQTGIGMLFVVAAQLGPPSGEARAALAPPPSAACSPGRLRTCWAKRPSALSPIWPAPPTTRQPAAHRSQPQPPSFMRPPA